LVLSIKHPDADRLARELARRQRKPITRAVIDALESELAREKKRLRQKSKHEEIAAIVRRCAALPALDNRSDEEILGYDKRGLFR
jgi:antitoxin VapB